MSRRLARTVITSIMGNLFEWYDFALFGYFAPVIGQLFFPSKEPILELLAAYGAFAAGYLARPLGGLFFGYLGDKYGRKNALIGTILLMAFPTVFIGCLPTYGQIGYSASVLLIIFRLLQGISMGGNYGGSITFTTEHSPEKHRGLIGSFSVTSCLVGLMLGSGTAALFSSLFSEADLNAWAWRIPFFLGIIICGIGFIMRRNADESPAYIQAKEQGDLVANPIRTLFKEHRSILGKMVLVVMLHDLSFYILFVYMTTHLTEFLKLSKTAAFTMNTLNMIFVSGMTVFAAWLSDQIGRLKVMITSAAFFALGTIPLLYVVNHSSSLYMIFFAQTVLAIGVGGFFGPIPAFMVETYPVSIRNSAIAATTNISGPLFGGTAPLVVTYLIKLTGSTMVPAFYLTIGAVIATLALWSFRKHEVT